MNKFRTPLKNVRGLGSAKSGTEHFIHQRLTATALVALTIWFLVFVLSLSGADYVTATAAIALTSGRETLRRLQARHHFSLELLAGIAFDVEHTATVAEFRKRHGQALATRTARAADTVHVVFGHLGQVIVEVNTFL